MILLLRLSIAWVVVGTLGCQSNYQISTNVDKENFQHYFSPSKVKIYNNERELPQHYQYTGLVEGEDCQLQKHHKAPDKINARTAARGNAFDQGANAIIFTGCALLESKKSNNQALENKQCFATIVCYGKAYKVSDEAENTQNFDTELTK